MKRRVCVVTGTRAEYGLLKPVIEAICATPNLEPLLLVTGMHLSREFGRSIDLIKKDGFRIAARVEMNPRRDDTRSMAFSVGKGIIGIASALQRLKPDVTLVLGDRIEALAAAIASAYMNIAVAHIHGGDVSKAGMDESARHAITKMSHIHFAATQKSRARIIKMGEDPRNIFVVGAPGIDGILRGPFYSRTALAERYDLKKGAPFLLLVQHPVTTQINEARSQITETLSAVRELKIPTVVIYPNSDVGGRVIIKELEKIQREPFIRIFKNLARDEYLSLLKHTAALIGNSSSGIIEASYFRTPVVNIGIRQEGRERGENVIDVPHSKTAIIKAINKVLYDAKTRARIRKCSNPYGAGGASERIARVLSVIKLGENLLQKHLAY